MPDLETTFEEPTKSELATESASNINSSSLQETQIPTTSPVEFVVDPNTNFSEKLSEYTGLSTQSAQYVLEKNQENFTHLSSEEAAALLIKTKNLVAPELTNQLEQRVLMDNTASEFYFREIYKTIDIFQLQAEIHSVAASVNTGIELSAQQLELILDSVNIRQVELKNVIQNLPNLQQDIETLQNEWKQRAQTLADATTDIEELTQENIQNEIPEDIVVTNIQNNGQEITLTIADPQTEQPKNISINENNLWGTLLILGLSDSLLGTNNLSRLAEVWVSHQVVSPLLTKLGIEPEELAKYWHSDDQQAFDGMLKIMDNYQCQKFFTNAMDNHYLYDLLKQADIEHIKKIFAIDGTKTFGSSGLFDRDHLQLNQELVDKMYNSLSESQRTFLRIPVKQ